MFASEVEGAGVPGAADAATAGKVLPSAKSAAMLLVPAGASAQGTWSLRAWTSQAMVDKPCRLNQIWQSVEANGRAHQAPEWPQPQVQKPSRVGFGRDSWKTGRLYGTSRGGHRYQLRPCAAPDQYHQDFINYRDFTSCARHAGCWNKR